MRISLISFVLIIFSFYANDASGQNIPGYLGQKLMIGYEANISPNLGFNPGLNSDFTESRQDGKGFGINLQHKLNIEYVIGKKWSVIGGFVFSRSAMDIREINLLTDRYHTIFLTGYTIAFKNYSKILAPIGAFVEYKAGLYSMKSEALNYSLVTIAGDERITGSYPSADAVTAPYLELGFGVNRAISDRLILTYGFRVGYIITSGAYSNSLLDFGKHETPAEFFNADIADSEYVSTEIGNLVAGRFFSESLVNLSIGVSFLP
jgi:hypothetical protein